MAISLKKGNAISLKKGLSSVVFSIQWDTTDDLDIHAFILQDNKAQDERDFIFYNQKTHPTKAIVHSGDVRNGTKNAIGTDDETITIDLPILTTAMPQRDEVLLTAALYDSDKDFGDLHNAIAIITDASTKETIATYNLQQDLRGEVAAEIARFKKQSDETWVFEAIGKGVTSLESVILSKGIDIE